MNYQELYKNLKPEIPSLEIYESMAFDTRLKAVTNRYPEGVQLYTGVFGEYYVETADEVFPFRTDTIKAVEFFVKRCKLAPAK